MDSREIFPISTSGRDGSLFRPSVSIEQRTLHTQGHSFRYGKLIIEQLVNIIWFRLQLYSPYPMVPVPTRECPIYIVTAPAPACEYSMVTDPVFYYFFFSFVFSEQVVRSAGIQLI